MIRSRPALLALALPLALACGSDPVTQPTLQTLTVVGGGSGAGTITSSPLGISCGATCSASFVAGTRVTLTAAATPGSLFNGWSGGGCSGNGPCVVTVAPGVTVTATFQLQSFTIAGTATTVVGSGCVLQLNGANNLTIVGNGLFTFGTPLLHGTAYATTILTQPTGPAQTCTLTNPNGTVSAANVTNIGLACSVDRPACATAENLGAIDGDAGTPTVTRSAAAERWYRLRLTEANSGNVPLAARVALTVPAGVDYDLFVYCLACGGTLAGSSTNAAGQTDVVTVRRDDNFLPPSDDSYDIVVQVRYAGGSSPSTWTLQITGNVTAATPTCN